MPITPSDINRILGLLKPCKYLVETMQRFITSMCEYEGPVLDARCLLTLGQSGIILFPGGQPNLHGSNLQLNDTLSRPLKGSWLTFSTSTLPNACALALLMEHPPESHDPLTILFEKSLCLAMETQLLKETVDVRSDDYRRIFQNSRDMIYLSSREGQWLDINQAGVDMLGYSSPEEVLAIKDIGRDSYFDPIDRDKFIAIIERDGYVKDYEVRFKRKDGTPIDVLITGQVRKDGKKIMGYEGIIKDITPLKEASEKSARDRNLLELIINMMPVGTFVIDHRGRVTHWNRAMEELTGQSADEILGSTRAWEIFGRPQGVTLAHAVLEGDPTTLEDVYSELNLRASPIIPGAFEAEAHFFKLGGKPRDLFFTASTFSDDAGVVAGAVETLVDTTLTKQLQRELKRREEFYRELIESYRDGLAIHDGKRIVFANHAFLSLFGLERLPMSHNHFLALLSDESHQGYLAWLSKIKQGESCRFTGKGIRGDEVFHVELTAAPTAYNGSDALLFTARDVSNYHFIQDQLIKSERLAASGKLAFDIAHEINNPLGGIFTYAHLLKEDLAQGSDEADTLEKIIKLANRCKIIVRGLLDFARPDSDEPHMLDINQVIQETVSLISDHVILKDVELHAELQASPNLISGHQNKLSQVFMNLIVNAAEAMNGSGNLWLDTYNHEDGGVVASVRDDGPGISSEHLAKIFDPFFTTKSRGRGTGLGLSISHGIVQQHNGEIWAESTAGEGTTFILEFPCAT